MRFVQAWIIIGSRTDGASIKYHTNKMGVFVKDLDINYDCCYYDLPFTSPVEIWAFGDPTFITATAFAKGTAPLTPDPSRSKCPVCYD
jgi:hypothetical protein